jgi:zinc D-Ala-D-Ala carboxypeptidase
VNRAQRVDALRALGWRVRTTGELSQVVRNFQRGWNLGPALVEDGHAGPKTDAALAESLDRHNAGKPDASQHFSFHEFACKCGGRYAACQRVWVIHELLDTLEKVRVEFYPEGLTVVSGCRCQGHNDAVGGATSSQHKYGAAADLQPKIKRARMRAAGVAAGIGFDQSDDCVSHIDRRDKSGHNTTGASLSRPTVWLYHR